ncbi:MAG: glycosyltransferase [Alphaproteobacteria bacterium]|nr:glycosyltransferase [Alphaproteobacteria bacterium]
MATGPAGHDRNQAPHGPIALVSVAVPPAPSGQGRALEAVLGPEIANSILISELLPPEAQRIAGAAYEPLPPRKAVTNVPASVFKSAKSLLRVLRGIAARRRDIDAVLARHRAAVVIACSGAPYDLAAGCMAARQRGVPFIAYLFDDPVYQWRNPALRFAARLGERYWSRHAAAVIVPNERLRDDVLARRRAAPVVVIRNAADDAAFEAAEAPPVRAPGSPIRIVYTGNVYHAQADSFQRLVAALATLEGRFRLEVFTSQPESELAAWGVSGPHVVRRDYLSAPAVYRAQRAADILFLPLAFRSGIERTILSSAPGKMGEYLASGRPILVHAPPDSFVCDFFRRHRCGHVVDRDRHDLLARALTEIAEDGRAVIDRVGMAARAAAEFRASSVRAVFQAAVARAIQRGGGR